MDVYTVHKVISHNSLKEKYISELMNTDKFKKLTLKEQKTILEYINDKNF